MEKTKISSHHFFEQEKELRKLINQMKNTVPIKLPRGKGTNRIQYIKEQLEYIRSQKQIINELAINTAELCLLIVKLLQETEMFVEAKKR